MGISDVLLTILVVLVAAVWGIKQYAKAWIPELVKAEIKRQYSLTDASASDRLSACKALIQLLDETRKASIEILWAAEMALVGLKGNEGTIKLILGMTMIKKHGRLMTTLAGIEGTPFDQMIVAIQNSFQACGNLLSAQGRHLTHRSGI